jgi:hypothetical protein
MWRMAADVFDALAVESTFFFEIGLRVFGMSERDFWWVL